MTATCPKGHSSSEGDFCSECGAKIAGATPDTPPSSGHKCPDCQAPRAREAAIYCELCGYNFETGAHGEIAMPPIAATPVVEKWIVHVGVDPTLKEDGSPDPPPDWEPLSMPAAGDTLLIGRRSEARNILPEISLDFDSAVSHRHAVLTRVNGSGWSIRDIGSANGTRVNGEDVKAMEDVLLQPGDRVTVGHWTCITLSCE